MTAIWPDIDRPTFEFVVDDGDALPGAVELFLQNSQPPVVKVGQVPDVGHLAGVTLATGRLP